MKRRTQVAVFGLLLMSPAAALAQNGCIHSPECPTALLGLVGTAGAVLYTRLRGR